MKNILKQMKPGKSYTYRDLISDDLESVARIEKYRMLTKAIEFGLVQYRECFFSLTDKGQSANDARCFAVSFQAGNCERCNLYAPCSHMDAVGRKEEV
jgi:hypothetical protein